MLYKCEICGKEFEDKAKYGGHKSGHSRMGRKRGGNKKDVVGSECVFCGKKIRMGNKYCSSRCQADFKQKEWEEKWLGGEVSGFSETDHWGNVPDRIRTYLFRKHKNKCVVCGWGEVNPYTGRIPLEVDHIDGDYKNNRPENVTLLCPNCHSLTEHYRGANAGKGRGKTWVPVDN